MEIRRSFKDFYAQASWRIWVGIKYMVSELVLLSVSLGIEEKSFLGVMFRSLLAVFSASAWFLAISGIALINFYIFLIPIGLFFQFIHYFVKILLCVYLIWIIHFNLFGRVWGKKRHAARSRLATATHRPAHFDKVALHRHNSKSLLLVIGYIWSYFDVLYY